MLPYHYANNSFLTSSGNGMGNGNRMTSPLAALRSKLLTKIPQTKIL